jgi:hypothetical protein
MRMIASRVCSRGVVTTRGDTPMGSVLRADGDGQLFAGLGRPGPYSGALPRRGPRHTRGVAAREPPAARARVSVDEVD